MDFGPLLYMVIGAMGSLVMWLVLGPVMTGLGVKKLAKKAKNGDPGALEFFYDLGDVLIKWASEHRIKTGKKVKICTNPERAEDEKAEYREVDEELSPMDLIGRIISNYMLMKIKAMKGGTVSQMGAKLEGALESDLALAQLVGSGPRKGQSMQEYYLEMMLARFSPLIEKKVQELINKGGTNTFNG